MVTYNGERIVDAAFAEQVYESVARIPRGKVATYGQIAAQVGDPLAGREVGHIMSLRSFWTEFALSQGREPYRGSGT